MTDAAGAAAISCWKLGQCSRHCLVVIDSGVNFQEVAPSAVLNTLTTDRFMPKLLKNAKCSGANVRPPQRYKVDFWQQLNLFVIYHVKIILTTILVVGT